MPQTSSGPPLGRTNSGAGVTATRNAVDAFGDDIADDAYSVSELSQYDDNGKGGKAKKSAHRISSKGKADNFARAKLSTLERPSSVSVPPEDTNNNNNGAAGDDSGSTDAQDDVWGPTGDDDESGPGVPTTRIVRQKESTSGDSGSGDSESFATTSFAAFALTRFQSKMPYMYACNALPHPLLPQVDRADYLASLASWVTILRIMGDLPDIDTGRSLIVAGAETPLATKVKIGFKARYSKKDVEEAHSRYTELFKDPSGVDTNCIPFLPNRADTMLDKIQLVCALGIYRPNLRDELYCQLCKQLSNNPSRNSSVRGWVLMSLFAGSFTPSEKFAPSLTSFLRDGPAEFAEKIDRLLRRTCSSGTRSYPASWLEFQSAKNGKPLLIPVTFMNSHRLLCEVDSATTVCEMLQNIKERLEIVDISGFSIYISLQNRISCLGQGHHRIMDAVSECEHHTKQMGMKESSAIWRIFFRREYFMPWHSPGEDPIVTALDYNQVKRGISMGEYRLHFEETLIKLSAKVFYVEKSKDSELQELAPFLSAFLPDDQFSYENVQELVGKVKTEIGNLKLFEQKPPVESVKIDVVSHAQDLFHILYSRYYDASKVVCPEGNLQDVTVGVNSKGVIVMDGPDKMRYHLHFTEIFDLIKSKHCVTLSVLGQTEVTIHSQQIDDFCLLVNSYLDELRKRATIAIAKQDVTHLDGPADSNIVKGDVLHLSAPIPENSSLSDGQGSNTVSVRCERTGKQCDVPSTILYLVAPATAKPPADIMARLTQHVRKNAVLLSAGESKTPHTLQQFAKANFRSSDESGMTKLFNKASIKRKDKKDTEHIWSYSKDAIKKPLLKRTLNREDIRKLACHCFTSIQTYMTNLVINDEITNYNLASDWILNPARRNRYLRDEIYCQIIKQLTNNPDASSTKSGWVLLALLTSLCIPSKELLDQCQLFLQASQHPLARECERNIKTKRLRGGSRLYSCHYQEHEMVSRLQPNIRVQVYLPNQSVQTLEVTSHTQVFDMKKEVAHRLHLKSFHEYSIFLSSNERVHCLADKSFYFDCLSHAEHYWFRANRRSNQPLQKPSSGPIIMMLKKIWVNGYPGLDPVADQVFHWSQELPNFLRGYHQVSSEKVPKLAALIYRAQYGADEKHLERFKEIAPRIIPSNYLDGSEESIPQKAIEAELEVVQDFTPIEAKTEFLKQLSEMQTYGSVFFEVKQRYVKSLPKNCLIAINYYGVHILDQRTKELVKSYEFYKIPNWAHDDNSFTFIIADGGQSSHKLLVETNVGHNMDDVLMSYVAWIMNYQMRRKHGFTGTDAGESIC